MSDESKDAGLIQVLAERMKTQRLPRVLSLKEKVEQGETLNEFDIHFLEEVFRDARESYASGGSSPRMARSGGKDGLSL